VQGALFFGCASEEKKDDNVILLMSQFRSDDISLTTRCLLNLLKILIYPLLHLALPKVVVFISRMKETCRNFLL